MRVAVIGSPAFDLGRLLARAGHTVAFAGTRDAEKLARAAQQAGPDARTAGVPDAIEDADAVVLAAPFDRFPDVAQEADPLLRGKIVIDTSDPVRIHGDDVEWIGITAGLTAAEHQQRTLGDVRLIKAFNLICGSEDLDELAQRTGDNRVAVPFAGDDRVARRTAVTLIADVGLVPIDVGDLADAGIFEPTSEADVPPLAEPDARRFIEARRSSTPSQS